MNGKIAHELVLAVVAIGLLSAGYAVLIQDGVPQPNSGIGYTLGTAGLLLMLSTETLYSLRKRLAGFHLGRMNV